MRYNKDFIAETLAEAAQSASEETRRWVDARGLDKHLGLESMQVHNFRENSSGGAEAKRLRIHKQIMPSITGSAIVLFILLFVFPAATLAQSSLLMAESRAQNAYPAILPKSPALRPTFSSNCFVIALWNGRAPMVLDRASWPGFSHQLDEVLEVRA